MFVKTAPKTDPVSKGRRSMKIIAFILLSFSVGPLLFLNSSGWPSERMGVDGLPLTAVALWLAAAAGLHFNAKVRHAEGATEQDVFFAALTHWLLVTLLLVVVGMMIGFVFARV